METWVQLPRCHSAAIHFHDLVVSAGNPQTRTVLSGSHLRHYGTPQPPSGGKIATFILPLKRSKRPVRAPGLQHGGRPPCRPGPLTRRRPGKNGSRFHPWRRAKFMKTSLQNPRLFSRISHVSRFKCFVFFHALLRLFAAINPPSGLYLIYKRLLASRL